MALPDDCTTVRVNIGPPRDFEGELMAGATVTFTPSTALVWGTAGVPLFPKPLKVVCDLNGAGYIYLPATDQPGFTNGAGQAVSGFTYKVQWSFTDRTLTTPKAYSIGLPAAVTTVELAELVAVTTHHERYDCCDRCGEPVSLPVVTAIAGLTGSVALEQLAELLRPALGLA